MTRGAWLADRGLLAATLLLAALATVDVARAQDQDIVVDGETITAHDIDQRTRFDLLATHQAPSREQVLDELRRETLALHEARRRQREVSDAAVEQAYANMAARMRLTPAQLTAALAQYGIAVGTLKRRIRADLAWQQLLRSRRDGFSSIPSPGKSVPSIDPRLWGPGPSPAGPRWCRGCVQVSDAGAAAGPTAEQQKCLEELAGYRADVENHAKEAQAESKKRPTRAKMCDLVSVYSDAEFEWLKFAEANMTKCGMSPQIVEQIKSAHAHTLDAKKKVCAPGQSPTGPRWCRDCLRFSDAGSAARRANAPQRFSLWGWRASPRLFCRRAYMIAASGRSAFTRNAAISASSASTISWPAFPLSL